MDINKKESNSKKKKKQAKNQVKNVINPELLNYITKFQNEQDILKYNPQIDLTEKRNDKYEGLNENIHFEPEKKRKARKSLLYLLNKLSDNTFYPEIERYFQDKKEDKRQEKQNEQNKFTKDETIQNNTSNLNTSKNKPFTQPLLKFQNINNDIDNYNEENNYKFQMKKRVKNEDKSQNNMSGFKKFKNDLTGDEILNMYSQHQVDSVKQVFRLSSQAKARRKIINEEKKLNQDGIQKKKKSVNFLLKILSEMLILWMMNMKVLKIIKI